MSPTEQQEVYRNWRLAVSELARNDNVVCKIGGLGLPFWGFGFDSRTDVVTSTELASVWRPFVEHVLEAFGADRCMMESNFPVDGRSAGFVPIWNALKHLVRNASTREKSALFHGTAARVYRIRMPEVD